MINLQISFSRRLYLWSPKLFVKHFSWCMCTALFQLSNHWPAGLLVNRAVGPLPHFMWGLGWVAKQAACSQCQSNSRGIGTAVSPLISACHMLSCKLHQRGNDRWEKKSMLVALGPLQTLSPRLNKWIQLAAIHRQLQGRRSWDLGPTAKCLSC